MKTATTGPAVNETAVEKNSLTIYKPPQTYNSAVSSTPSASYSEPALKTQRAIRTSSPVRNTVSSAPSAISQEKNSHNSTTNKNQKNISSFYYQTPTKEPAVQKRSIKRSNQIKHATAKPAKRKGSKKPATYIKTKTRGNRKTTSTTTTVKSHTGPSSKYTVKEKRVRNKETGRKTYQYKSSSKTVKKSSSRSPNSSPKQTVSVQKNNNKKNPGSGNRTSRARSNKNSSRRASAPSKNRRTRKW
jgi:hypothetical protein